jgi:hypothetical protein
MDSRVSWLVCAAIAGVVGWLVLWSHGGNDAAVNRPPPAAQPGGGVQVADSDGLREMLSKTFTENDPKQCTQNMTRAFLRHSFGATAGTLDRCHRSNTPQSDTYAESVTIESVTATGSSAIAVIKLSGGPSDGTTSTYRVVRENRNWKLDQLTDLQIDRARLDQTLTNELGERGYLPAETTCAMAKYDQAVSDADIERSAVVGDPTSLDVAPYAASCLSRPTLLRQLGEGFTAALALRGITGPVVRCVVERMTHGVPTVRLRHLLAAGERGTGGWAKLGYEAALGCMGGRSGASPSTSAA